MVLSIIIGFVFVFTCVQLLTNRILSYRIVSNRIPSNCVDCRMFNQFLDMPRREPQRLAAWGITVPDEFDEETFELEIGIDEDPALAAADAAAARGGEVIGGDFGVAPGAGRLVVYEDYGA